MKRKHYVTTITIKLPFYLKWLKKFVKLEVKKHNTSETIRGHKIDTVIIDEARFMK